MRRVLPLAALALLASGCASVRPEAAADDLRATLADRAPVTWRTQSAADAEAALRGA